MRGNTHLSRRLPAVLLPTLALALLGRALVAQQAASLHGTVVNAVTHQPIARALVSLEQFGQSVLTDNEGGFAFDGVPVGPTMLSARRPGFASGMSNESRQRVAVPETGEVRVELIPQASITGELILPNDDSPDALQVQLLHQEIENGRADWALYRNVEATSDGRFRFGNLPAGAYLVHLGASPDPVPALPPDGTVKIRSGYVTAFYPSAREIAAAGVLTLKPGEQADIKMELTREPFYPVTIPVANAEDARGIGFEVSSDSFLGLSPRFSSQDGMAHIDLPAGHYVLEAHSFGQRQMDGLREFDVNGAPTRTGAITLLPVHRIPVTFHVEFTRNQAQTGNDSAPRPLTATNLFDLNVQRAGGGPASEGQRPRMQEEEHSASSGASSLVGATPGRYWVNARPYNGYVAAMTSGGVNLLEAPLTVSPDGSAAPIDVTLRDDMGSLSASFASSLLPSGQVAPNVYLTLIPRSGTAVERTETLALSGTETLTSVAPGSYLVFAARSPLRIEYRNPAAMAALLGKGQAVTIEPGGTASLTIDSLLPLEGAP